MADEINYLEMYEKLQNQLSELVQQRTDLENELGDISKKIESLQLTLMNLGPLAGFPITEFDGIGSLGITDAVRAVLDPQNRLSPAEVKTTMEARGYDFSKYSAPDASIRTILKRLVEAGKAEEEKEGHKIFYRYLPTDEEIPF